MKKINVVVEVEEKNTGLVASLDVESKQEIEKCIDKYIDLFKNLPPVGLQITYADCPPVKISLVDFSTLENCVFIYFETV